jgi:hypothetical protein
MTIIRPTVASTAARRSTIRRYLGLAAVVAALSMLAELIGSHEFDIGIGTLTLLPLIWGILLGAAVSLQRFKPFPVESQRIASYAVQVGELLLASRLAFVVGENISVLVEVGPALLLQELGNLGTILLGLPIAILLGLRRASVGATYSIDREGSFVIVGERFGTDSDERRGVLAMYVFGTVFGAIWIGLLASVLAGLDWFDPLALAMGSGVGSGSMMAAASNAIAAANPALAEEILALAAVSNLLSGLMGAYVGVYLALPLADKLYRVITRNRDSGATHMGVSTPEAALEVPDDEAVAAEAAEGEAADATAGTPGSRWAILGISTLATLLAVWTFEREIALDVLPGLALIVAIAAFTMLVHKWLRVSSLVVAMTVVVLLACPWSPVAEPLLALVAPLDFLPMTTPVLVLAGLGLAKDAHVLRKIGWRIVPVGLAVLTGTFLGSVLIADLVLSVS